ncbi:death-on-curing protein [Sinomonas sp. ASV486]|uniref:type II toxin-antitoxin system death-on-curing family toxin n=1 Tax=Sinomonas sp. ASV486 TaxID=3051170 RepID=UPI0027DABEBD|nr:Fic family protein [Sinomonas sp. ASV486]MDQ4489058.1 death-on-curing protein [Sinomonas sp. ASV486]
MTAFLDLEDALFVVERMGIHVKDAGLLASALARPATAVGGHDVYQSLPEKAAALLESVTRNQALIDGNRRTAWTLTVLFLWINGFGHTFSTDEAFDLMVGVAARRRTLDESARVIAARIARRD